MPTVSRGLPAQPHLDIPKHQARELLTLVRRGIPAALDRVRRRHPRFATCDDAAILNARLRLADAQLVLAREYGFASWPELKRRIEANSVVHALRAAIRDNDCAFVRTLLAAHPDLLHVPLWSGNWGPPMSHAANLGRLEIVAECHALGARDHQHAFGRAILQGQLETARWLHAHGAAVTPDLLLGPCETLNPSGLRFLLELGAPLADVHGNRLAPLALVLETYGRNPAGKHACLDLLATHGIHIPDTPLAALHRGRAADLARHLDRDPTLLDRRFRLSEIYPAQLGCAGDGRNGLHGTPLDGGTLLHLAVDFEETEIAALLLRRGADVNARAALDADGFGGHTPLFHALVACGRGSDPALARTLLAHGADPSLRASLRKFLDWVDEPRRHEARDVTAREWATTFPEQNWVNPAAVALLDASG